MTATKYWVAAGSTDATATDLVRHPLTIGVDLRHVSQTFRGQGPFASLAVRLFETYTHQWPIGQQRDRIIVLTESVEVTPAFESVDALRLRALVKLLLPLVPNWGTTVGYGSDYMENAAPSFKQHYWKVDFGFQYSFGG